MTRYYFNMSNGSEFLDHDGLDLPTIDAARIEAARALAHMLRDGPAELWSIGVMRVTVLDHDHALLFSCEARAS